MVEIVIIVYPKSGNFLVCDYCGTPSLVVNSSMFYFCNSYCRDSFARENKLEGLFAEWIKYGNYQ